jgi:hypothetical protein
MAWMSIHQGKPVRVTHKLCGKILRMWFYGYLFNFGKHAECPSPAGHFFMPQSIRPNLVREQ